MPYPIEELCRTCVQATALARDAGYGLEIVWWSGNADVLCGRDERSVTGLPLAALFPAESPALAQLTACLDAAAPLTLVDVPLAHSRGEERLVDVHADALTFGGMPALVVVVRDRHQRQAAVDRWRRERRAAFEAATAKLAHEVRNPLGSVLLNLALLRETLPMLPPADTPPIVDPSVVLAAAESQIDRIQLVLQQYVDAVRGTATPAEIFADIAELLA